MATGFICQADLLGVLQNPDLLEEHLQRMAASSGADATAGAAIEVVERYQSEHVGQERANSAKPLRRAMDQRDTASEVLRRGRGEHQEWLELAEEAQVREEQLRAAEGRLMRFDIACAQREVEREARRLMRAEEIAAKYPASRAADSSRDPLLANEIAGALGAWAQVPVIQKPTGPSPNALSE